MTCAQDSKPKVLACCKVMVWQMLLQLLLFWNPQNPAKLALPSCVLYNLKQGQSPCTLASGQASSCYGKHVEQTQPVSLHTEVLLACCWQQQHTAHTANGKEAVRWSQGDNIKVLSGSQIPSGGARLSRSVHSCQNKLQVLAFLQKGCHSVLNTLHGGVQWVPPAGYANCSILLHTQGM